MDDKLKMNYEKSWTVGDKNVDLNKVTINKMGVFLSTGCPKKQ